MLALRYLGTARTGAYFSLAPFIGALLSLVMFKDVITLQLVTAGMLMALGLHLAERHEHEHVHDEHHQHAHAGPVIEPHSHWHRHAPMRHTHRHYPDLHHRHRHG